MDSANLVVLGGGIVGLATAYRYTQRFPGRRVVVVEKEAGLGRHQTGHNSGVLHSGIYYRPGSLKAINCRLGKLAMEQFCLEFGVPYEICGKVIVANSPRECETLEMIHQRGVANGVRCELIGPERLRELEPHAAGSRAIHVPETGIVDYRAVCQRLAEQIEEHAGSMRLSTLVRAFRTELDGAVVETTTGDIRSDQIVNCTGLQSDRVARKLGAIPLARIVPFRGEYYQLTATAQHLCRNLIYPVPDPAFPFLGVHFTRIIGGTVECGPNAVLSLAREGYHKFAVNVPDALASLAYGGFWRLAWKHWRMGASEMWRSWSKRAFVRALQRLVPEIQADDLMPAEPGIRAQALLPDGQLEDDFVIQESPYVVHVLNAPSPAATSSLNIGSIVVDKLAALLPATMGPPPMQTPPGRAP